MNWKKWFGDTDQVKEKAYVFENDAAFQIKTLYDARNIGNHYTRNSFMLWKAIGKYIPEVANNTNELAEWGILHTHLRVFVGKFDEYSIREILKKYEVIIIKDVKE